ncbi:hypothetical protein [Gracilimonas mengyeensis]|uniref:Uncharacterized protein n=1 Tax=Gracilimonas mengyeensis TaxID=1302730 RepID=A0A521EDV6_9BACT|nr:hypothetical protein [Gracilimonas mengyeensis]SMO82113.1 hypothetical protein SAMN06265219_111136 [Gracilimonas mengyeensis]
MSSNSIDYSVTPLKPYIRLTNSGNDYTLWVMVPLPLGYYLKSDDNPQIIDDPQNDTVNVNIYVEGPQEAPTDEWYAAPLKIALPSPDEAPIKISGETPIIVKVYLDDPEFEGESKTKYNESDGG